MFQAVRTGRFGSKGVARGLGLGVLGAGLGWAAGLFLGLGPIGPGASAFVLSLVGVVVGYSIGGPPGGFVAATIVVTCALTLGALGAFLGRAVATDMDFVAASIGALGGFIVGGILGAILIGAFHSRST